MKEPMREIVSIFEKIKATSSKNNKEAIIKESKDNELFREVLNFLYNPFVLTGLKSKKMVKFANFTSEDVIQLDTIQDAMDYIKRNNTGKDEDIKVISNFINKGFEVGVGSGFSDRQRVDFWNNPDKIVGSIIEMQYFEESNNKDGGLSLRFPTFKRVRNDKDEVSYD